MADKTSTQDSVSKSLSKAMSFKNDVKSKLVRKKSVGPGDKVNKREKRKSFKRTGSFNNSHKKEFFETKNDIQRIEESTKKILQSINYVDDVVNKGILELLSGAISVVLEILIDVDSVLSTSTKEKSSGLKSSQKSVSESLSDLMKWSDQKLFLEDASLSFDKKEGRDLVEKLRNAALDFFRAANEVLKSATGDDKPAVDASIGVATVAPPTKNSPPRSADVTMDRFKTLNAECSSPRHFGAAPPAKSPSINGGLSYSADDILDNKPPPKPPIPQLLPPPWKFIDGLDAGSDIMRSKKTLPPSLPIKSRGGSLLSDSHSDSQSNASVDTNRLQSCESIHRSPTNSVNSILSASSEEFLLDDAPPPKPPRTVDRRIAIDSLQINGNLATMLTGCSKTSFHSTTVVQKSATSSFSTRVCSDGQSQTSFVSSCTRSFSNISSSENKSSSSSSSFVSSSVQESLSVGKMSSSSSASSSNQASCPLDVAKKVDVDPNVPPPLPPKQKPVETYMSILGSPDPTPPDDPATAYSSVMLRHKQLHRQLYLQPLGSHSINFRQGEYFQFHMDLYGPSTLESSSSRQRGSATTASSHSSGHFSSETGSSISGNGGDSSPPSLPPKTGSYQLSVDVTPSSPLVVEDSPTVEDKSPLEVEDEDEDSLDRRRDDKTEDAGQSVIDMTNVVEHLVLKKAEEEGPEVRGGSVDALIVHATVSADFMFQEAFLMTYRTFLLPQELIRKLIYRYHRFSRMSDSRRKFSRNAFSLIVRVLDDICTDTDSDVLETVVGLTYTLVMNVELKQAQKLRERCIAKMRCRQQRLKMERTPLSSYQVTSKSHSVLEFKSHYIAEQMTLLDFELFQKIDISEVLLWSRQQKEELSPNLTKFTEHFNRTSYWCRTRILERDDAKEREKYLVKFIKIMKHLRQLNNFNSYLAILSALDSAPVRRLDWQKQNVEALKDFCQLIDSSSSFRAYRQTLSESKPPCIPYIGLILQDLTFIHIGNPDLDYEGKINFNKCWQLFAVIDTMCRFKRSTKYNIKKNDKIVSFFNNFDSYLTEDSLWQISEIIKPRQKKQSKQLSSKVK